MSHEPEEVRSKRRRLVWSAAGLLLLLLVCLLYAFTLQSVRVGFAEFVLRRATGAHIQLTDIRLEGNAVALGRLAVRDMPSAPPLLRAEGMRLTHRWNPFAARPLQGLSAASVHMHLAATEPARTNYEFVLRRLAQPQTPGDGALTAIPERLHIGNLCVRVERPTLQFSLEGIETTAEITSLEHFAAHLSSTDTHLAWITPGGEGEVNGQLDLQATASGEDYELRGHVRLTDAIELDLSASASRPGDAPFEITVRDAVLHQAFWPQLLSEFLPVPVAFEELRIETGEASGVREPRLRLDSGAARIYTRGLRFDAEDLPEGTPEAGTVEITARQEGSQIEVSATALLPGALSLEGSGALTPGETSTAFEVSLDTLEAHSPALLTWLAAKSPYPLSAERVTASGITARGLWGEQGLTLDPLMLDLAFAGAEVGDPESPWYTGDLHLQGNLELGSQQRFEGQVRLNAGDAPAVQVLRNAPDLDLKVELPAWTRSQLAENLPPRLHPVLERLPGLEGLAGPLQVTGKEDQFAIVSGLSASVRGMPQPLPVKVQGTVSIDAPPLFRGQVQATSGDAEASAQVVLDTPEQFQVDASLTRLDLDAWVPAWTHLALPEDLQATASGTVSLNAVGSAYVITVDQTFPRLRYGALALPEAETASAQGRLELSKNLESLKVGPLTLQLGEGLGGTLEEGQFRLGPLSGAVSIEDAETDLLWLGERLGLTDLYGNARFSATLTLAGSESITAAFTAASDSLGYGNWATPYGVPLTVTGAIEYLPASRALTGMGLKAQLGDTSSATVARMEMQVAPGDQPATLAFEQIELSTDLTPAVALELLGGVSGIRAQFSLAQARKTAAGWNVQVTPRVEGDSLALPGDLARLEDLAFQGEFTYANHDIAGVGSLRAARLVTGGVTVHGVDTRVRGEGSAILFEEFESTVFDGAVRGRIRANLAAEGLSVEIELAIDNIDLATFTREFNPPEIKLTGRASGAARVVFNAEGIQDFEAKLLSNEGFTLNRDMLTLMAEYMEQNVSSSRQIQRGLTQVIGQMEQRPFDSAELDLGFENNLILGVLRLKSRALDFNINVDSDPESLVEALRVRQAQ